jgi:hypothetical protein
MDRFTIALAIFLSFASTSITHADWQYTRWGMSIDDLLAAGSGAVTRTTPTEAKKQRMGNGLAEPVAKAKYRTKDFAFDAYFFLKHNRLAGIRLIANPEQLIFIKTQLEQVYGKPFESSSSKVLPTCELHSSRWRDDVAKNVIMLSGISCYPRNKSLDSAAILYEPTLTKGSSGL